MTEVLDEYSDYYADLLDSTYDCVDRIVLNAYFRMGQGAGGFRTWWRQLMGSDDKLDMRVGEIRQFCKLQEEGQSLIRAAMTQLNLSVRTYHHILKLARTIADLAGSEEPPQAPRG